jgi:hypothetical protein
MYSLIRVSVYLFICLIAIHVAGQRVLLVEKPGSFKNFKYFEGEDIILRTYPDGDRIEGTIHLMTDSSIIVNYDNEIQLENIERIIRPLFWIRLLSKSTRIAGAGYFVLDAVNNTINNETIIDEQTVKISAGLVAFSYALVPFQYRRIKIGNPWRLKILDFSMDVDPLNPFLR